MASPAPLPPAAADEAAPPPQTLAPAPAANGEGAGSSGGVETLERAAELFEKGSKALECGDAVEAVDYLSRALEIRVAHHGELAPECALSYYRYGCALLLKAQEEGDPLVDVPKNNSKSTGKDSALTSADVHATSQISVSDSNQDALTKQISVSDSNQDALTKIEEVEEDGSEKDQEDADEGSEDDNEESGEAEEEDSDLDMAWKMLELARAVAEKQPEDTIEKVNILSALGEVSAEREDIETSLNDYLKALSMLERLVEPDSRRIVELNFRICLVLELGSKIEEAIPYCRNASSLCNSRLQRLKEDSSKVTGLAENNGDLETEIGQLRTISSELERKLEDMQQSLLTPQPDLSEVVNMLLAKASAKFTGSNDAKSSSLSSSQLGVNNAGFDSPTVSTAATNGSVTHLGVVGRGVKRTTVNLGGVEPSSKRSSLETTAAKGESSISEVVNSTAHDVVMSDA